MQNHYVLDATVLIEHPLAMYAFDNSVVILPYTIFEQLSNYKKSADPTIASNAHKALNTIDNIAFKGNLNIGVPLDNNSTIKVFVAAHDRFPGTRTINYSNSKILITAKNLQKEHNTTLISENPTLRLKAKYMQINATSYNEYINHYLSTPLEVPIPMVENAATRRKCQDSLRQILPTII